MSAHHHDDRTLPPWLLIAVASLIGFTLVTVTLSTLTSQPTAIATQTGVIAKADLRFVDIGGGEVAVYAWPDGHQVATLQPGTENFIRGVLRGLARERRGLGIGDAEPFRITRLADGRVTLEDLATGRILVLDAFGATNSASFENLIDARQTTSAVSKQESAG